MTPKQECGPEFCGACEVPAVCENPAVLTTAKVAIRSLLKGHTDVRQQLDESLFDNDQLVAIWMCYKRNSEGLCRSLSSQTIYEQPVDPPHLETC